MDSPTAKSPFTLHFCLHLRQPGLHLLPFLSENPAVWEGAGLLSSVLQEGGDRGGGVSHPPVWRRCPEVESWLGCVRAIWARGGVIKGH